MPLDPYLASILSDLSGLPDEVDFASYRAIDRRRSDAMFATLGQPGPEVRARELVRIPVDGGEIEALVYLPFGDGPHPAHLFVHGGGWALGSIHHAIVDATCRERCIGSGCVVVSVGYRKSPEAKFPVPLEDCHAALTWLVDRAGDYEFSRDRITVGGQSAGANLAAALALKVRDDRGPRISFQLLEVPALDLTLRAPSLTKFAKGYGLTSSDMRQFRRAYLEGPEQATHPYASPVLAPDLEGAPRAHIMTAEFDPLRDDGARYAQRLAAAGVTVSYAMHAGHVHGSGSFTAVMEAARSWRHEIVSALAEANGLEAKPLGT